LFSFGPPLLGLQLGQAFTTWLAIVLCSRPHQHKSSLLKKKRKEKTAYIEHDAGAAVGHEPTRQRATLRTGGTQAGAGENDSMIRPCLAVWAKFHLNLLKF